MLFQSKSYFDTVKIYIVNLFFLNHVAHGSMVKLEIKLFSGCYLIICSHYIWMVDIVLPLHDLAFGVICQLIW